MSLIYTPQYFDPEELISPEIFAICGADALYMYDPLILEGADQLRDIFGPMICNTWHSPWLIKRYGKHRFRGLRATKQRIGARKSAHKLGINKKTLYSAIDLAPVNVSPQEMHEAIKSDIKFWSQYFKRIETHKPNGQPITWFHGDSKPHKYNGIRFFRG